MILKSFQYNLNKLKCTVMFEINIENLKKLKYHIFKKNSKSFIVYSQYGHEYEKIFKGEESIEILKFLV